MMSYQGEGNCTLSPRPLWHPHQGNKMPLCCPHMCAAHFGGSPTATVLALSEDGRLFVDGVVLVRGITSLCLHSHMVLVVSMMKENALLLQYCIDDVPLACTSTSLRYSLTPLLSMTQSVIIVTVVLSL